MRLSGIGFMFGGRPADPAVCDATPAGAARLGLRQPRCRRFRSPVAASLPKAVAALLTCHSRGSGNLLVAVPLAKAVACATAVQGGSCATAVQGADLKGRGPRLLAPLRVSNFSFEFPTLHQGFTSNTVP